MDIISGDPTTVLQIYLSIITKGIITGKENGLNTVKGISSKFVPKNTIIKSKKNDIIVKYSFIFIVDNVCFCRYDKIFWVGNNIDLQCFIG